VTLSACAGTALGDGCVFLRRATYQDILQPTQKVYIRHDGVEEKLLIQTKYEGPAEEMVWIVPVPAKPTVALGEGAIFEELSKETAYADISYTSFTGLQTFSSGGSTRGRGGTNPVE